jgi:hypothetical protein
MGGSQDANNSSDSPLHFAGKGQSSVQYQPTSGWNIPSSHPEAIAQGIEQGVGNLASGVMMAKMAQTPSPNATGGYNTTAEAKQAAPYAAGYSKVEGIGVVPRAQGVNYQPDQGERYWGYGNSL